MCVRLRFRCQSVFFTSKQTFEKDERTQTQEFYVIFHLNVSLQMRIQFSSLISREFVFRFSIDLAALNSIILDWVRKG